MEPIEQNNRLIAEFMGYKYETGITPSGSWHRFFNINDRGDNFSNAQYNTSWDWLMPVVEKIIALKVDCDEYRILSRLTPIHTPIDRVYKRVIQFIKYYNEWNKH